MSGIPEHSRGVLLVGADPDDARLVEIALARTRHAVRLHSVSSGQAALQFLRGQAPYEDAPAVHLVLLDPHVASAGGPSCLAELRVGEPSTAMPVIAFSSADDPADVREAYRLGASAVIARPRGLHDLITALDATLDFFFRTALLPEGLTDYGPH
jgi:CheY-like chemotaxis protein